MKPKPGGPSQLIDLFLSVADQLGLRTDRDLAALAGVSVENVANWRSGAVSEFKPQKLAAIKANLAARIEALREQARAVDGSQLGLSSVDIEEGSSPGDLQRQFRDRVLYDYLGHRFLYFEPQGALAWEVLIRSGYEQDRWVRGTAACAEAWLDARREPTGRHAGPIASALADRAGRLRPLEMISLGPGEGSKEAVLLEHVFELERRAGERLLELTYVPVDVSIPLLLSAAKAAHAAIERGQGHREGRIVFTTCADFEEGRLAFARTLPSSRREGLDSLRLVLVLGNVFGNLRDEEAFVRTKLSAVVRPGDFVWLEVGLRLDELSNDPLFRLTQDDREATSAETNRRVLLEGPYRRWEAALGRPPRDLKMRVWLRENDESSRIPRSINFCHDLVIEEERRRVTMLYSRRYDPDELGAWFSSHGYRVERVVRVEDGTRSALIAHFLLRRTREA